MNEERIAMRNGDSNFCVALSAGERGAALRRSDCRHSDRKWREERIGEGQEQGRRETEKDR